MRTGNGETIGLDASVAVKWDAVREAKPLTEESYGLLEFYIACREVDCIVPDIFWAESATFLEGQSDSKGATGSRKADSPYDLNAASLYPDHSFRMLLSEALPIAFQFGRSLTIASTLLWLFESGTRTNYCRRAARECARSALASQMAGRILSRPEAISATTLTAI